ncbi:MAG: Gfo/Idh/MocA family oxidoreductase [Chloroflexota bacterium]|nr:Gfo/Idh/MocA family oxidoreductase [Chloroflexota bacterium]
MTLRLAQIGCGEIGDWRARAADRSSAVRLVLACDVSQARARCLGERYRAGWTTEWRDAVTRPDVDAVVLSTLNDTHHAIGLAALGAGKHLVVEKPLARTPEECRELVECARANGVRLMTGFNHRRYPPFARARAMLSAGAIGQLLFVRGRIGHPGGSEVVGTWHTDRAITGGGTLMDNGVHLLDLVRFYVGEVESVHGLTASARWAAPGSGIEDVALATFRARGGVHVTLTSTWIEWPGYVVTVELYGAEGYLRAHYPPLKLVHKQRSGRARTAWFPLAQVKEKLFSYRWPGIRAFQADFEEFAAAVRDGRDPSPSGVDGLRAVEMAYGVYRSAEARTEVPLP